MEWDASGQDVYTFVLQHVLKGAAFDPAFDVTGIRGTRGNYLIVSNFGAWKLPQNA